jgi:hypothetical protein
MCICRHENENSVYISMNIIFFLPSQWTRNKANCWQLNSRMPIIPVSHLGEQIKFNYVHSHQDFQHFLNTIETYLFLLIQFLKININLLCEVFSQAPNDKGSFGIRPFFQRCFVMITEGNHWRESLQGSHCKGATAREPLQGTRTFLQVQQLDFKSGSLR